mgnify:CR=1 FL=1
MALWSYTVPSAFGRDQASNCGLFLHSDLRNVGVALGKLASYAEAVARPLPERFDPVSGALPPGLSGTLPEYLAKVGVPFHIENQDTYAIVKRVIPEGKTMCSLCSRLRRGVLYRVAKEIGAVPTSWIAHPEPLLFALHAAGGAAVLATVLAVVLGACSGPTLANPPVDEAGPSAAPLSTRSRSPPARRAHVGCRGRTP